MALGRVVPCRLCGRGVLSLVMLALGRRERRCEVSASTKALNERHIASTKESRFIYSPYSTSTAKPYFIPDRPRIDCSGNGRLLK